MKFEKFDNFVCIGDRREFDYHGLTVCAKIRFDSDYHIDDDDCHNTDKKITGCNDEEFKKLMTARNGWFNNQWFYCGIEVSVLFEGKQLDSKSLWGIECNYPESDNNHLSEVANELLCELDIPKIWHDFKKRVNSVKV
jgi:hypothetical protein